MGTTPVEITVLPLDAINVVGRIREDLGDIDGLSNSIREFGIIQPIVIERNTLSLVAGGRRWTGLKRLGIKELRHGKEFIWRDEETEERRLAVELEENLRRKDLSWQEQVLGKKRLLEALQKIHGVAPTGRPTKIELATGQLGFGVNKLSAMLGESISTTIQDLKVAEAMSGPLAPLVSKADTKTAAYNKMKLFNTVVGTSVAAAAVVAQQKVKEAESGREQIPNSEKLVVSVSRWTLFEGPFQGSVAQVASESVDLVHTDLPYGASVEKMSAHLSQPGFDDSRDTAVGLLGAVARESFRVLRPGRYGAFWFGFNYYPDLVHMLELAGFTVPPVPLVWVKNTKSGENPTTRYSNGYEACLVVCKGQPMLMRPGATNVKTFSVVPSADKTHIAEKPVDLILDIMRDLVPPRGIIVDFMAGSGSTGVAALRHNCTAVLFEKEPFHCRTIRDRMTLASVSPKP